MIFKVSPPVQSSPLVQSSDCRRPRAHAWGSKDFGTTLKYLDRESKYFEVVGPHGGPAISEGVQILQHYSEVIGPGGPNTSKYLDRGGLFQGGPFFS